MAAKMRKLRAENRELKRANEILKSASVFFRSGARPQQQMIIDYINRYKSEYGVEPICRVLTEHGCSIAPSSYYEARGRAASRRAVRDEELEVEISRTLEWVDWFNHRRLYEHCGDVPPVELEAFYYGEHRTTRIAEFSDQ